jgi:hypothetical protein
MSLFAKIYTWRAWLKQLSSGTGDHTNGEDVSLGYDSQQTSTKLEAHSVGSAADG